MIRLRTHGTAAARLRDHAARTAPAARSALAGRLLEDARTQILVDTPVDTGRLRRGWQQADAVHDGSPGRSRAAMTNAVPYVGVIEYGGRHTAPRRVVRTALRRVASRAAALFRLTAAPADPTTRTDP